MAAWVQVDVTPVADDDGLIQIQGRSYDVDSTKCSCSFSCGFSLPCSHIFFLRLCKGQPLYADGDIPPDSRWAATRAGVLASHSRASSVTIVSGMDTCGRTKTEKFRLATAYMKQPADDMSDCGEDLFAQYLKCCKDLSANVKQKQLCTVLSMASEGDVAELQDIRAIDAVHMEADDSSHSNGRIHFISDSGQCQDLSHHLPSSIAIDHAYTTSCEGNPSVNQIQLPNITDDQSISVDLNYSGATAGLPMMNLTVDTEDVINTEEYGQPLYDTQVVVEGTFEHTCTADEVAPTTFEDQFISMYANYNAASARDDCLQLARSLSADTERIIHTHMEVGVEDEVVHAADDTAASNSQE